MSTLTYLLVSTLAVGNNDVSRTSLDSNYTVLLRHGSLANCPCFRIPTLVATGKCKVLTLPVVLSLSHTLTLAYSHCTSSVGCFQDQNRWCSWWKHGGARQNVQGSNCLHHPNC